MIIAHMGVPCQFEQFILGIGVMFLPLLVSWWRARRARCSKRKCGCDHIH